MIKKKVTAVLGPTNTGKTHLAIETMLSFDSGMIGFPLRLLAREVYDKVIKKVDLDKVALITGEEKIIPPNAKYFLCTVESMPIDKDLDFVGVDEIQMCADHERGHIFTDRLINSTSSFNLEIILLIVFDPINIVNLVPLIFNKRSVKICPLSWSAHI